MKHSTEINKVKQNKTQKSRVVELKTERKKIKEKMLVASSIYSGKHIIYVIIRTLQHMIKLYLVGIKTLFLVL